MTRLDRETRSRHRNLTFACDACHALITDSDNGWETITLDRSSEHPGWTGWKPPRPIDPARRPRVNLRHHPEPVTARLLVRHPRDRAAERPRQ